MAENLYTFGVYDPETFRAIEAGELTADDACYEEIDVHASNAKEAERKAKAEADDLYGAGNEIWPMQAGGSGGLVQVWSL